MFRRFWRSESGNFAIITAITSIPLLAGVAAAVDYTHALNKGGQLQNSLDASALAIATAYHLGMSDEELTELGRDYYKRNMVGILNEGAEFPFEYDDELSSDLTAIASSEGNEDFIIARSALRHTGLVGGISWPLKKRSVVKIKRGPLACVLALDPAASAAVKFQGSTDITLEGCVIASNSKSDSAISRGGSALLTAACTNSVGGTSGIKTSSNVHLDCSTPMENQYPSFDPLAGVVPPTYTGCKNVTGGKTKTLSPGTYCNQKLSGDITLEPGSYILRGGSVDLNGNGVLKGAGVTVFLMEDAQFSINGNEVVQLTPPTSGPYAGIVIYQEKSNTNTVSINGTSDSYVSGFIYAPGAHVFYAGNSVSTTQSRCLRIVGNTVEMTGNSDLESDCSAELGGREMFAGRYMSIVR
ncbi:TadE/TadG family type IV pilus assembly protein [Mesorhizobium sp. KR9-304]|uniref:TadE/TadG family type IV pilus assembly protein n=1 Tax=Mesorhizobium sp. KR9-304 TaxID=3156614 RepID=UPI0032B49BF2